MKRTELVHVAVAETSVIVRSGLVAVLKRMPDLIIQPVEITSLEGLQNCMQGHQPDILIINPTFGGWFKRGRVQIELSTGICQMRFFVVFSHRYQSVEGIR